METVSSKVPANERDEIDEYADRIGETRSVAVRQLIRAGLAHERRTIPFNVFVAWLGSLLAATGFTPASDTIGTYLFAIGGLLFLGGLAWPFLDRRLRDRSS